MGVFWKCLHTFLYLYTHFVMSSRLACIPMALPVPWNGPACPSKWPYCPSCNFFFYQKYFHLESFWECFGSVYTHFYTCTLILLCLVGLYVFQWPNCPSKWPCLCLKNGPNVNVVIFLYQKGVLLWKVFGVFWKCLYTFLYMYTHFVMSSGLLCIPVA